MKRLLVEPSHEEWVGNSLGFNIRIPPDGSPARWFAKTPKIIGLAEPETGLWLPGPWIRILGPKFHRRGLIATQYQHAPPRAKIRHDPQVIGDGLDRQQLARVVMIRDFVEDAMAVHQHPFGFNLPDPHPFGVAGLIESLAAFG